MSLLLPSHHMLLYFLLLTVLENICTHEGWASRTGPCRRHAGRFLGRRWKRTAVLRKSSSQDRLPFLSGAPRRLSPAKQEEENQAEVVIFHVFFLCVVGKLIVGPLLRRRALRSCSELEASPLRPECGSVLHHHTNCCRSALSQTSERL